VLKASREVLAGFATRPLNVAANLASIVGLVVVVIAGFGWDSRILPLLYVCGLSLFLLIRYVRQERWARYAEGVQVMDRAQRRLKEATDTTLFGEATKEMTLDRLQQGLSAFAEAFTLVTGTNCRASIKEVYVEDVLVTTGRAAALDFEKELFVATIVRSDADASARISSEIPDRVSENSDFKFVLSSIQPFHCGDLPKEWLARRYDNSHWHEGLRESRDFPYRSSIVWPIESLRPGTSRDGDDGEEPVIAVLCVDSKRRHAFRPGADLQFGSLFAHAVYPVLRYERS